MFIDACDGHRSIREAWMNGVDVIRMRDRLVEMNMPFANKMAQRFYERGNRAFDIQDLCGAAYIGLVEAVDQYEPDSGNTFTFFAKWRIYKNLVAEWERTHWRSMRPPRGDQREFFSGRMDGDDRDDYRSRFITAPAFHDLEGSDD